MHYRLGVLLAFCLLAFAARAQADTGFAITVGVIEVNEILKPGSRYELPPVGVINTGQDSQSFKIGVGYLAGQSEHKPQADWLEFHPQEFALEPGKSQQVQIHLDLPAGADPGNYFAYIEAAADSGQDESVQASVATKLSFAVAEGSWLDAKRRQINRWLDDAAPWTYVVAGGLLVGIVLRMSSRRLRFRLPFELR